MRANIDTVDMRLGACQAKRGSNFCYPLGTAEVKKELT